MWYITCRMFDKCLNGAIMTPRRFTVLRNNLLPPLVTPVSPPYTITSDSSKFLFGENPQIEELEVKKFSDNLKPLFEKSRRRLENFTDFQTIVDNIHKHRDTTDINDNVGEVYIYKNKYNTNGDTTFKVLRLKQPDVELNELSKVVIIDADKFNENFLKEKSKTLNEIGKFTIGTTAMLGLGTTLHIIHQMLFFD